MFRLKAWQIVVTICLCTTPHLAFSVFRCSSYFVPLAKEGAYPPLHVPPLGDLSVDEVAGIQAYVDAVGGNFTLYVVGSAANGRRRRGGLSDIDYLIETIDAYKRTNQLTHPLRSARPDLDHLPLLPGLDFHGVLVSPLDQSRGQTIRFAPGQAPEVLPWIRSRARQAGTP